MKSFGIEFITEHPIGKFLDLTASGVTNIDFVIPDLKIAIEVDGPSHFVVTPTGLRLSQTTIAKARMLRGCG